ncbi:hypothetical protein OROGR_008558 [Orobanche gracilis]
MGLVSEEQAAFVPGRLIHNILLAQEIMRSYGRRHMSTRCMIKLDLQKAYDLLHWGFIENILRCFGFPHQFVCWLMIGLTTVSYQVCPNGQLLDAFPGKKGLRQGDPISPYLFVLCMEYLSRFFKTLIGPGSLAQSNKPG